jgi:hypothetical protein
MTQRKLKQMRQETKLQNHKCIGVFFLWYGRRLLFFFLLFTLGFKLLMFEYGKLEVMLTTIYTLVKSG